MRARLLHAFSTFVAGGPQVRAARLIPALDPEWQHSILALDGRTDARELLPAGVEVLEAPPKAGSLRTVRALLALLRSRTPELVLTYNWGAIDAVLAARMARIPVVHHEDGFRPDEVARFKRRRVLARRWILPRTEAVIVPSATLEQIATGTWGLAQELVARVPNGIRVEDFLAADGNPARRAELGIPASAVVVGSVGHLRPEKNYLRLLEALALLPASVHLLLLGDGPERAALERARDALGLAGRVHLVGHRSRPQDDYRAMDVFALSSDTEQLPVALLEAMASALPVATTDVGDVRATLPPDQAACVVPLAGPETARGLARALGTLAGDAGLRARLGKENRRRAGEHFGFDVMASRYCELYARALAARRPAAASRP